MRTNLVRQKTKGVTGSFYEKFFLEQKLENFVGYFLVTAIACLFGYLVATQTIVGLGLFAVVIGFFVVLACILSTELGLYINMVFAFFCSFANRLFFNDEFPVGIVADILGVATFLSLFVGNKDFKSNFRKVTHTSIMIAILLYTSYLVIELFNPYARSFDGWFQTFRRFLVCIFMLYIAYTIFSTTAAIRRFIKILFIISFIVGLYGCIQQWHGLFGFELKVVYSGKSPGEVIFINGGDLRKFSTVTDPMAFGVIMAACATFFLILSTQEKNIRTRLIMIFGSIIMMLGMVYSGTRTANVMVVMGIGMFCLMTINRKSTRIFLVSATLIFIFLLKVPIYNNGPLNRFRSSFIGKEDASFNVREVNRKSIQPYIYAHPIGGGLCTTGETGLRYNPGHELAGFPPDSSYLRKALETGWIGLIFIMVIYFITLKYAVRGYFESRRESIKIVFAAATATLFSFYISEFPQEALGQLTDMVVYYPLVAIIIRLRQKEQELTTKAITTVS